MVYHARRKGFQLEVHHAVTADNHSGVSAPELVYYQLQCVFVGIQVVAVELYGKASAFLAFCGQFPAPAYAEVSAPWYDVHKAFVFFQAIEYLCCAVGGVVVYNNDVERKVRLLRKRAFHGVLHRACAVAHRYYHRGFRVELLF